MKTRMICLAISALLISPTNIHAEAAAASGGACEQAVKKGLEKCHDNIQAPTTGEAVSGTIQGGSGQLQGESAKVAALGNAVKAACLKAQEDCKKSCKTPEELKKCEPFGTRAGMAGQEAAQATDAGQQAAQTGDASGAQEGAGQQAAEGGGMNPGMAAGLLGAAGGILAAMMGKKKDDQNQQPQMPPPTGALQANRTIDCSKSDAGTYSECNDQLAQLCMSSLSSAQCQAFASRYCGSASETAPNPTVNTNLPTTPPALGDGIKTAATTTVDTLGQPTLFGGRVGANGEGIGTPFCKVVVATKYCSQSGRDKCPSCVQLAINKSPICVNDPALCLAQNSPDQINQAKQTCPTDPAFSDPTFVAGGGAQLPPNLRGGTPAVLPQKDGLGQTTIAAGGGSGGPSVAGTGGSNGSGGISTSSIRPASAAGGYAGDGVSEGRGGGAFRGSDHMGAGDRTGGGYAMGSRETASVGGGYRPSSAGHSGPASDVQGQYGPSVFALGSQIIRNRCAAGKLLNCP